MIYTWCTTINFCYICSCIPCDAFVQNDRNGKLGSHKWCVRWILSAIILINQPMQLVSTCALCLWFHTRYTVNYYTVQCTMYILQNHSIHLCMCCVDAFSAFAVHSYSINSTSFASTESSALELAKLNRSCWVQFKHFFFFLRWVSTDIEGERELQLRRCAMHRTGCFATFGFCIKLFRFDLACVRRLCRLRLRSIVFFFLHLQCQYYVYGWIGNKCRTFVGGTSYIGYAIEKHSNRIAFLVWFYFYAFATLSE